ncbi:hypothetical protein EG352_07195 [Chryseobacterium indologenes]|uniref:Uncharacterized protein n=1 Tax=Chryseobacterium indologenes TaxID=253 RepID=A0AAD1DUX7_CHRID|nr:hypothetical protein [Chryseobacterium indologenes]AZB17564.1 hypothetical protein EG352_07195 [Chryseobacterium indologenes]
MKVRGTIMEDVSPKDKSVIVRFEGDENNQHFEIHCNFSPFYKEMKKWDIWDFIIKLKSEVFIDPKTKEKSYFTLLVCSKASLFHENGSIGAKYRDK